MQLLESKDSKTQSLEDEGRVIERAFTFVLVKAGFWRHTDPDWDQTKIIAAYGIYWRERSHHRQRRTTKVERERNKQHKTIYDFEQAQALIKKVDQNVAFGNLSKPHVTFPFCLWWEHVLCSFGKIYQVIKTSSLRLTPWSCHSIGYKYLKTLTISLIQIKFLSLGIRGPSFSSPKWSL